MKLDKTTLKELVREALNAGRGPKYPWWVTEMRKLAEHVNKLYWAMPKDGRELLTKNFEGYVEEWKKEQAGYPEDTSNLENLPKEL